MPYCNEWIWFHGDFKAFTNWLAAVYNNFSTNEMEKWQHLILKKWNSLKFVLLESRILFFLILCIIQSDHNYKWINNMYVLVVSDKFDVVIIKRAQQTVG